MPKEFPSIFELLNWGCKKPDLLSTDGSGWKNFGKYNIGTSYIFNTALL